MTPVASSISAWLSMLVRRLNEPPPTSKSHVILTSQGVRASGAAASAPSFRLSITMGALGLGAGLLLIVPSRAWVEDRHFGGANRGERVRRARGSGSASRRG